jgi:zinc D-Ala-D-Ala carboxypeptidase
MSYSEPARTAARTTRMAIPVAVVVSAALIGVLGHQSLTAWSSSKASPLAAETLARRPHDSPPRDEHGVLGEADGVVPDGVTVFDDALPAVANLDHDLLGALRRAASEAAGDGVDLHVNSGWRSPKYQEQLLLEAISRYGSEREAARWVATPDTSAHVSGEAIDIGPSDAAAWLSEHGARYGLCQIYDDEPWHYELRPDAVDRGCPPRYADPTHDPRTQQ